MREIFTNTFLSFHFNQKIQIIDFFPPNSNPLDLNSNSAQKYEKISQRQ